MLKSFVQDETGATAIEYGLIAALIAVVIIAALTVLGQQVSGGSASSLQQSQPLRSQSTIVRPGGSPAGEFVSGVLTDLAAMVLWGITCTAALWDLAKRRIPNVLVGPGMLAGLILSYANGGLAGPRQRGARRARSVRPARADLADGSTPASAPATSSSTCASAPSSAGRACCS